jgi:hypothetical protein
MIVELVAGARFGSDRGSVVDVEDDVDDGVKAEAEDTGVLAVAESVVEEVAVAFAKFALFSAPRGALSLLLSPVADFG